MAGLLLATLITLSPGVQLADNVEARHVALSDARLRLQFVADDDEGKPSLDAMTREQLAVELRRLDKTKPSLVGPIVMLSIGVALAVPGVALVLYGLGYASFSSSNTAVLGYLIVFGGSILLVAAVVLALVGGIMLAVRLVRRGGHAEETDEVRKKIDLLDQAAPPAPPPGPDMVPPPPPPPPSANFVIPGRLQTVMTF